MTHEHFRAFAGLVIVAMTAAAAIFDWIHLRRFSNADATEAPPAGDADQGELPADERVSEGYAGREEATAHWLFPATRPAHETVEDVILRQHRTLFPREYDDDIH